MARFGTVLTAMVTPFDADGALDVDTAVLLAKRLVDEGNEGLILAGTTGESPTITKEEQLELFGAVRDAVNVPLLAGAGSNDTASAISMTKSATDIGCDAILSVTPYYNRPSQEGLYRHFRACAEATHLPVMLYDIAARTGREIAPETMLRLANDVPNIVAVKDASGDPATTATTIAHAPDGFEVYSGDDSLTLPLLAVGAVGVVGVATHWCAPEMVEMIAMFNKGDVVGARALNQRMLESFAFETGPIAPNPVPAKAMMRTLGVPVGECRPPMGPTPVGLEDRARQVMANLQAQH